MPSAQGGTLVMLNPHYAFVVDDVVVDDVVVDHDHAEQSSDDEGGSIHSIERSGGGDGLPTWSATAEATTQPSRDGRTSG